MIEPETAEAVRVTRAPLRELAVGAGLLLAAVVVVAIGISRVEPSDLEVMAAIVAAYAAITVVGDGLEIRQRVAIDAPAGATREPTVRALLRGAVGGFVTGLGAAACVALVDADAGHFAAGPLLAIAVGRFVTAALWIRRERRERSALWRRARGRSVMRLPASPT